MKTPTSIATLVAFACAAPLAQAEHFFEDYARVIEVTPQYEEVNVPRKECTSEYVPERQHRRGSLAGPIIGGIAGGVLGAQVGSGNGRVASSAAGAAIGAIVGDRLSQRGHDEYYEREVRRCELVDHWETRLAGYGVVYRYRGHVQTAILPYDPGRRLRVRVAIEPVGQTQDISDRWDH
ncbi:MAG: glycine zipper 2TM domain-containing protein [Betaproteobacteria bacterium]|nr:MAG: glycine zipper 2TM domain-containing protein [Betaproteobacteria bacterium]